MGACGLAALVVLLLASALLPSPAATGRVLEGEKPSTGEGAPAPTTVAAGGSSKSDAPKESGQSKAAGQQAESKRQPNAPPPPTTPNDSKLPSAEKGQEGGGTQASASPPPPPLTQETDAQKGSPPPGGPGPNGGGEAKGGTDREDTGSQGKEDATGKMKEAMEKCDASRKCSFGGEFSACLQVSNNASIGSHIIVLNEGQNDINVNVKAPSNIDIDNKLLHLAKGVVQQVGITHISPDGGDITLNDGNGDCVLHIGQSVSDWQQQFQQFAAYATRLNPIYGASFFVFTVVLVGVVCACCKFARRRGNDGVPYQQLEMGAQAPNTSGVENTTSTTDGWEDGWDDDWDDEEAPARPSDKKPASSVSANGLSSRSQTNSKDGWDVDWDD
ncbi:uncharacterized protein LOC133884765 [Phragmites australis]|uniref:uncharacterized protein LOC133884765 n=1 Tax=Phragmites australis TaxID=29695 RepID=UPI002D773AF6|nr:uncharacterized protein LOC133884765 [Phragmites australis]